MCFFPCPFLTAKLVNCGETEGFLTKTKLRRSDAILTSFDKIEDLALTVVSDYKLGKLFDQSEEKFKKFCDGLLMNAVAQFTECRQDLTYDDVARSTSNAYLSAKSAFQANIRS